LSKGERIDKLLVERGLADSRTKAQAMVMAGIVLANEKRIEKPSDTVSPDIHIRLKSNVLENRYVSRGGLKLEQALSYFHIHITAYVCLDIGSSTGGFTDCLLKRGATKVVAIDSGTNQMAWNLRNDPRVELREKTNARYLKPAHFSEPFDLAVIDVSFTSLTRILPVIPSLLKPSGKIIALIKPQFEVERGEVEKGGVVRDPAKHKAVLAEVNSFAAGLGLRIDGVTESPILGAEGNKEFLALYAKQ